MTGIDELHTEWMADPAYAAAYEGLEPEFAVARALIEARARAGLTQQQLARRLATSEATIARFESGKTRPSTRMLERIAHATGTRLRIDFEPIEDRD